MITTVPKSYDPREFRALTFHDAVAHFRDGSDTPRAYLERCLETIAEREAVVRAFVTLNLAGARAAADDSTRRWKDGHARSPIDGLPIGIKDLLETKDMPTQMGCEAYRDNFPRRDNAAVWALRQAGGPRQMAGRRGDVTRTMLEVRPAPRSSFAAPVEGCAPGGKEGCEEGVLFRRLHCQRGQRHGRGEGDMVALGPRRRRAVVGRMRLVDPDRRLDEARQLRIVGPRLEQDAEPVARRPARSPNQGRDHLG